MIFFSLAEPSIYDGPYSILQLSWLHIQKLVQVKPSQVPRSSAIALII